MSGLVVVSAIASMLGFTAIEANADPLPVVVSRVGGADQSFSPDGDGQEDSVGFSYCLSESANVDVRVVPVGVLVPVRVLELGKSHPGGVACASYSGNYQSVSWDGKSDAGAVAADGRYRIVVTATDPQAFT